MNTSSDKAGRDCSLNTFQEAEPVSMETAAAVGDGSLLFRQGGREIFNEHSVAAELKTEHFLGSDHCCW